MLLKKYILPAIVVLIFYGAYFFFNQNKLPSNSANLNTNIPGASGNLTLYEEPDSGRQFLVDAIESARQEVLVEVYLLSDKQIITSLEDAKAHGADVKVMMEQHPFGGGNLNQKTKIELDAKNVTNKWSSPSFSLTHEKAIVIDASEVFVLSQNLTTSSFTKNREYDILDTNPTDVSEVRNIFIDDWERKSFTAPDNSNIIESPGNSRSALMTLINNSKNYIDTETEDINDNQIIQILSDKAKIAKIRLIVPTIKQLSANEDALRKLVAAGVEVKTITSPYMHAKMITADGNKTYIGSINFSAQSMDRNRELGIIMSDSNIIQKIEMTFESDWVRGTSFTN